jgi:NAD(P)H-hydrate repair Nnr-like enzyme with NAD(P)H-hydrate dehydratase domain
VIATADNAPPAINPTGNAGLSTAGTGDVLAGMIGALLAQGMPIVAASRAAVWIHGRAADRLVAEGIGPAGLTASELYQPARAIFNALLQGDAA